MGLERVVSGSGELVSRPSSCPFTLEGSTQTAPFPSTSESLQASASCMAIIEWYARHHGFSRLVDWQLALAERISTRGNYWYQWHTYRRWCKSEGHSILHLSLLKTADFLLSLRSGEGFSVSTIKGYKSVLSCVSRNIPPKTATSDALHDLMRSSEVQAPVELPQPPSWDLNRVLEALHRVLMSQRLLLISKLLLKRPYPWWYWQLSYLFRLQCKEGICLSLRNYGKNEDSQGPFQGPFHLSHWLGLWAQKRKKSRLCPVRASQRIPCLREIISGAQAALGPGGTYFCPRVHSVMGVAMSMSFMKDWLNQSGLDVACWKWNSVFASFYLVQHVFDLVYPWVCLLQPTILLARPLDT